MDRLVRPKYAAGVRRPEAIYPVVARHSALTTG
jgi:hypothetical protein